MRIIYCIFDKLFREQENVHSSKYFNRLLFPLAHKKYRNLQKITRYFTTYYCIYLRYQMNYLLLSILVTPINQSIDFNHQYCFSTSYAYRKHKIYWASLILQQDMHKQASPPQFRRSSPKKPK